MTIDAEADGLSDGSDGAGHGGARRRLRGMRVAAWRIGSGVNSSKATRGHLADLEGTGFVE